MTVAAVALVLLALLGMPLFAAIGAAALLGFHAAEVDLSVAAIEFYRLAEMPTLLAIPLFTFAGYLLSESSAPVRLVALTRALLGWLPGGLALVALAACAFFTAFTGASGMTIVAIGAFLYPALTKASYPQPYSLGLVTSSGSLGLLFAPSLPLILFGFVAGQLNTTPAVTVQDLFLAGLLPGALMILMLSVHAMWIGRHLPKAAAAFDASEVWAAVKDAKWELPLPFIVLGGIYSGQFAASEAAAITTLYVLIVTVLIKREIRFGQLPELMAEAMRLVGAILIILGAATALSNWMVDQEVPNKLFEFSRTYVHSAGMFLLLLNAVLLLVGMFMDIFSAIVILTPLLVPVAVAYGIHPVHFGIVMLANLQIGYFMPPAGMDLFIAAYRFKTGILTLTKACAPFFLIVGLAVLIITWWPWLSLVFIT